MTEVPESVMDELMAQIKFLSDANADLTCRLLEQQFANKTLTNNQEVLVKEIARLSAIIQRINREHDA